MDLHDRTALEQAAAIRSGDLTSTEMVRHYLHRIDALSERVGAFIVVLADSALAAAGAADDVVRRARAAGDVDDLPPLWGVPVGVKDLVAVGGVPMTLGTAALDPVVAAVDDHVVARMRSGGMPLIGTTAAPEFGLPAYTDPDGYPPARTPWDLDRSAGGSSGGSAAAVAAGLVSLAHGNDGGGSVRTPASVCGLVGLKPSRGG